MRIRITQQHRSWAWQGNRETHYWNTVCCMIKGRKTEPEAAGSRLGITIGAELTALKRTVEGFTILQYYTRSTRIM
eukprot:14034076-Ditylum_brightwellii.AAC.1